MSDLTQIAVESLPALSATLGVVAVAASKEAAKFLDVRIPARAKPLLAVVVGAFVSQLFGADVTSGVGTAGIAVLARNFWANV